MRGHRAIIHAFDVYETLSLRDRSAVPSADARCWARGYVHSAQSLQLSGTGRSVVAFELTKEDELRVRVVDAGTGTPLRAHVTGASADGSLLPFECPGDADGISYVCWVSAGKYRLTVAVPGYPTREVEANAPGTLDVPMK